jgi:hypothetical protein
MADCLVFAPFKRWLKPDGPRCPIRHVGTWPLERSDRGPIREPRACPITAVSPFEVCHTVRGTSRSSTPLTSDIPTTMGVCTLPIAPVHTDTAPRCPTVRIADRPCWIPFWPVVASILPDRSTNGTESEWRWQERPPRSVKPERIGPSVGDCGGESDLPSVNARRAATSRVPCVDRHPAVGTDDF